MANEIAASTMSRKEMAALIRGMSDKCFRSEPARSTMLLAVAHFLEDQQVIPPDGLEAVVDDRAQGIDHGDGFIGFHADGQWEQHGWRDGDRAIVLRKVEPRG